MLLKTVNYLPQFWQNANHLLRYTHHSVNKKQQQQIPILFECEFFFPPWHTLDSPDKIRELILPPLLAVPQLSEHW